MQFGTNFRSNVQFYRKIQANKLGIDNNINTSFLNDGALWLKITHSNNTTITMREI